MYKLCERSGYTYDMRMYLERQRYVASTDVTPTHGTVVELVWKDEEVGTQNIHGQLLHLTETF
jgi:hypothetical protein